jgi:serine acetyltransferase
MGANCTIGHNVTIGRTEKEHGYPTFGDNVYIAPGAVVIGTIEIGDNVKIGPNAVVRRSVPSNSVVMAIPPKVIRMTSKEEWLQDKDSVEDRDINRGSNHVKQKEVARDWTVGDRIPLKSKSATENCGEGTGGESSGG